MTRLFRRLKAAWTARRLQKAAAIAIPEQIERQRLIADNKRRHKKHSHLVIEQRDHMTDILRRRA